MHFPKLRILWSPNPHATAELFEELKRGRDEPDAKKAASISIDFIDDYNVDRYNPQVKDFLSKLPGITSKNIFAILNTVDNLMDLLKLDIDALEEILGSKQAAVDLHESLHINVKPVDNAKDSKVGLTKHSKKGSRFRASKK